MTPKEFELLLYLSKSPEKIFTREVLLKEVWKYEFSHLRTVDTHVKRLREKLLKQSKAVSKMIVTVWGMGYKFSRMMTKQQTTNNEKDEHIPQIMGPIDFFDCSHHDFDVYRPRNHQCELDRRYV